MPVVVVAVVIVEPGHQEVQVVAVLAAAAQGQPLPLERLIQAAGVAVVVAQQAVLLVRQEVQALSSSVSQRPVPRHSQAVLHPRYRLLGAIKLTP